MNISQAIALNKTALARIVAGLFALLAGAGDAALARIPIELHRSVARVLRPAESAVRRLIVVLAKIVKVKERQPRPVPTGLVRAGQEQKRPAFQLFDPRQRFLPLSSQPKPATRAQPRITFFGDNEVSTISWGRENPTKRDKTDDLANPANLLRRLQALKAALDNLPHQARRLVRALARRQKKPRLKLKMPMRPGRAPGYRRRPVMEIDHVLHQCDWLAREALVPDTS